MKKAFAILVCLPLLALSSDAKTKNRIEIVAHAQGRQESLSSSDRKKDGESEFQVSEAGIAFAISAGMIAEDDSTVRLALKVINATTKAHVFSPSEIVVILPNGHSYRPFSQVDVLAQAYEVKAKPKRRREPAAHTAPSEISAGAGCSVIGDSASCQTTPDSSTEAWSARRLALGSMIRSAVQRSKFKKYIEQVKKTYLVSQEIGPGDTVTGYVDLYLEDIHNGPFTVRVPAGGTTWFAPTPGQLAVQKTTYDFRFGPELIGDPRQSPRKDSATE
ncbi:MAG: hypothetical protein ABSG52_00675 [Terriglobales bacterium]|jgi:hypothetical protein